VADDARRSGGAEPTDDPVRSARSLLAATTEGPGAGHALLVTLGSSGAVLVRRDEAPVEITAPKVNAVDATGAGDALNGALAAALATGLDLETAARRAVVAASLSVTRAGAREGMPTVAELRAALGEPDPAAVAAAAAATAAAAAARATGSGTAEPAGS
jgi:sugar/nucleoside kinase (ribokinase family)